jgi:hypothetical protein
VKIFVAGIEINFLPGTHTNFSGSSTAPGKAARKDRRFMQTS